MSEAVTLSPAISRVRARRAKLQGDYIESGTRWENDATGSRSLSTRREILNRSPAAFHRVGVQDVFPHSPQILRSGRLLPCWLCGLELRRDSRGSVGTALEWSRVARSDVSVRGQSHRIAIRLLACSPHVRGNHPSIWASFGHRFVWFFEGA